ncbi:STAS domain-containing protein [Massilia sp. YIM B02769]|uniref:STAS domain-containing protein n=1 Tax=Massilia sp. YIM B02769 TaxID=3050129 RepID=UPI0025B65D7A|nr:STAS domain-containing protein [Massilia sp. YIM B02769]MDN4057087.1 STAS domain-containing protein [Massilia sp. YIM B02769]
MGLFSFLKKKNDGVAEAPATRLRAGEPSRLSTDAERERQRDIARATAAKIDAIELAMTTDLFDDLDAGWGSGHRPPAAAATPLATSADTELGPLAEQPDTAVTPANAPVVEESAILYANGQADLAEGMLRDCLGELGRTERLPWWMLFDLYQAQGREQDFDSIAIDYASHFETSPPAYTDRLPRAAPQPAFAGVAPALRLPAALDASLGAHLAALRKPAPPGTPVRLDFGAVRSANPEGCGALLASLQALRREERAVVLAGADALLAVLRPMLAIGERGSGEAPWLLLLELLQLLDREKDFEETAMDYCVTFEVSPPSFETPLLAPAGAASAAAANTAGLEAEQRFLLPPAVDGDIGALLAAIDAYAASDGDVSGATDGGVPVLATPVVLDCSRLARIGFTAAGALHVRLRSLAGAGHPVELRELNHMVAALLRLLNYGDCARLYAHRY